LYLRQRQPLSVWVVLSSVVAVDCYDEGEVVDETAMLKKVVVAVQRLHV